jgi:hypothetical protein
MGSDENSWCPQNWCLERRKIEVAPARWSTDRKGPGYTAITIIEALANYFKHKDEWRNRWSDLQQIQRRSANVLRNIGLLDDKDEQIVLTGNFRDAFMQIFGDDDYTNVGRLTNLVHKWRDTLKREYQSEFTRLKAST